MEESQPASGDTSSIENGKVSGLILYNVIRIWLKSILGGCIAYVYKHTHIPPAFLWQMQKHSHGRTPAYGWFPFWRLGKSGQTPISSVFAILIGLAGWHSVSILDYAKCVSCWNGGNGTAPGPDLFKKKTLHILLENQINCGWKMAEV